MANINYKLIINNTVKGHRYFFSYRNTQKISLVVNRYGAEVSFGSTKYYPEHIENKYLHALIKESIKRAALLYILLRQKPLTIKKLDLIIMRKRTAPETIDLTGQMVFYQMFDKPLLRLIGDEWKNPEVLQNLLKYRKSKDNLSRQVSALYAYLFSKTKKKEMERFSYLWIAMNGFFAAVSGTTKDRDAMNYFVKKYDMGSSVLTGREREKICLPATFELMKVPEPITKEKLDITSQNPFTVFLDAKLAEYDKKDFDVTPYGFLLTDFPYYLRCCLFHASHPIELFSFESDWELKSLRIVNGLLEEFLDRHLQTLFLTKNAE